MQCWSFATVGLLFISLVKVTSSISIMVVREHHSRHCGIWKEGDPEDLKRPITDVLAENQHEGHEVPGMCYFEGAAPWITYTPPPADYTMSAESGALSMRAVDSFMGTCSPPFHFETGQGPLMTAHFEGSVVSTHVDCPYYTYDDLYFYSLGWLKNQRVDCSLMSNATAWNALVETECDHLMEAYNFTDEELTFHRHIDDNPLISLQAANSWTGVGEPVTSRMFALHVYAKCLLGGAPNEMAYSCARACLLPGDPALIGHEAECL